MTTAAHPQQGLDRGRVGLLLLALLLFAINLAVELRAPIKDDIAWLIYVAQSWLDGGQPYVTEIEINPPPIIWFSALAVWFARLSGLSALAVYPALTSVAVALIAWWVASMLVRQGVFRSAAAVFALILAVLLFVPTGEFGQREHLIASLSLPWLAWRATADGPPGTGRAEGFAAGLLVGASCALKPHFLIPVLLVEAVMWRRGAGLGWPAMLGAIASGGGMLAIALVLHPAYFADVVPLALSLYHVPFDLAVMVPRGAMLMSAVLFGAWGLWWVGRAGGRKNDLALVLLLFSTGALVIYFLPARGWFYHRIPATVATVLALCAMLPMMPRGVVARGAATAMLLALAGQAGARYVPRVAVAAGLVPALPNQIAAVARAHGASGLMAFSSTLGMGFPVVDLSRTQWSSRFASMWAVRSEITAEQIRGADGGSSIARRWVVDDFLAACPDIVVVDHADGVDYPGALSRFDPAFARAWSGYQPIAGPAGVEMFFRPTAAPPCREAQLASDHNRPT